MSSSEATGRRGLDLELLREERVVAILRSTSTAHFPVIAETLVANGIRIMEFSLTTPDALAALTVARRDLPDDVQLGAGTVVSVELARAAVDAGATFLVTPAYSAAVIAEAVGLGVPVLAGALTPTEVLTAWEAGATAVKLFPASIGGPGYCRALREPFPAIPLVPTGGIHASNAAEFLDAGALALGVSRSLTGDAAEGGSLTELAARAAEFVAAARSGSAISAGAASAH